MSHIYRAPNIPQVLYFTVTNVANHEPTLAFFCVSTGLDTSDDITCTWTNADILQTGFLWSWWNHNWIANIFIQAKTCQNVVCKMAAIFASLNVFEKR